MIELKIDTEFKNLLWPLSSDELKSLEESIRADGCRDAIVVWEGTILDGHNRYGICKKHNIEFRVLEKSFESRDQALDWIDLNQAGRRNITPDQLKIIMARRLERSKKTVTNPEGKNQYVVGSQNDHQPKTHEQIAAEHGVSPSTVQRAVKLYQEVERIKTEEPEVAEKGEKEVVKKAKQNINKKNKNRKKEKKVEKTEEPTYKNNAEKEIIDKYYRGDLAMRYAKMAIAQLESIERLDPDRKKAFNFVIEWARKNM